MQFVKHFLIILFATAIAVVSMSYLDFTVQRLLLDKPAALLANVFYRIGFYGHIIFGIVALMTGPWQFMPRLRARYLGLHRLLGKVYVIACLLGGLAGLGIAYFANTGWVAAIGFAFLAVSWLYTTTQAYLHIRRREVQAHRVWMNRSYALTFAAVTLRLYLGPMIALGVDFAIAYPIVAYACWIPNLLFMEIYLRKRVGRSA